MRGTNADGQEFVTDIAEVYIRDAKGTAEMKQAQEKSKQKK